MKRTHYYISRDRTLPWKEGIRGKQTPMLMIALPLDIKTDKQLLQNLLSGLIPDSALEFTFRIVSLSEYLGYGL